ncbi:MAG: class I SAM-dependent methyltransferase [Patescibacteria group bacterium]|nr:class I SAM-dependent methyltransferase [Patescibacteria group bacterium]
MNDIETEIKSSHKKTIYLSHNYDSFLKSVQARAPIFYFLKKKYNFKGEVLELGAGSCWLSALMSKIPEVKNVYAVDISKELLERIGNKVIVDLRGNKEKIKLISADFHKLPFADNKFDVIICDASLHHAQNLPIFLKEANRVLKEDGFLVAVREPIKSFLHYYNLREFGKKEIGVGATENIYSKTEWKKYFDQTGFELNFFEEFNKVDKKTNILRVPFLKSFNGILFSRYYFFATKK